MNLLEIRTADRQAYRGTGGEANRYELFCIRNVNIKR